MPSNIRLMMVAIAALLFHIVWGMDNIVLATDIPPIAIKCIVIYLAAVAIALGWILRGENDSVEDNNIEDRVND